MWARDSRATLIARRPGAAPASQHPVSRHGKADGSRAPGRATPVTPDEAERGGLTAWLTPRPPPVHCHPPALPAPASSGRGHDSGSVLNDNRGARAADATARVAAAAGTGPPFDIAAAVAALARRGGPPAGWEPPEVVPRAVCDGATRSELARLLADARCRPRQPVELAQSLAAVEVVSRERVESGQGWGSVNGSPEREGRVGVGGARRRRWSVSAPLPPSFSSLAGRRRRRLSRPARRRPGRRRASPRPLRPSFPASSRPQRGHTGPLERSHEGRVDPPALAVAARARAANQRVARARAPRRTPPPRRLPTLAFSRRRRDPRSLAPRPPPPAAATPLATTLDPRRAAPDRPTQLELLINSVASAAPAYVDAAAIADRLTEARFPSTTDWVTRGAHKLLVEADAALEAWGVPASALPCVHEARRMLVARLCAPASERP